MESDTQSRNRALKQMEHVVREVNREVLNSMIPPLETDHMLPVMAVVAKARGLYLKELFKTAQSCDGGVPSDGQLQKLKHSREAFEELLAGAHALEVVVERGYVDVAF